MSKNSGNLRRLMQEAAVELFLAKGFDETTAAQIAARAGVTERTFFRHFPDKRDVLFDEQALHTGLYAGISEAPSGLRPLEVILWAFQSIVPLFEQNRPLSEPAQRLIARTPALQERQLTKIAAITATMAQALLPRGINPVLADLAATTGMGAAALALRTWFEDPGVPLVDQFESFFQALARLVSQEPDA